ncbi:hypothetical protein F5887DRAFT_1078197 [Amanita rubescens]|nr:hypothetical protein F5887DRAFT_1078197 [Amanita rubescens]
MPPDEAQQPENDGATQTRRYGLRATTLTAHPGLPDLSPSRRNRTDATTRRHRSRAPDKEDKTRNLSDPEVAAILQSMRNEDAKLKDSIPMPPGAKTVGLGKPSSREVAEASGQPRSTSAEVRAGSKRGREGMGDVNNAARSPKLRRSASVSSNDNTGTAASELLRLSVSGTIPGWRANRTLASPPPTQGVTTPQGKQSHHGSNDKGFGEMEMDEEVEGVKEAEEVEEAEAESSYYPKHTKDSHTTCGDQRGAGSNDKQAKGSSATKLGDQGSAHSRGNALTHGVVIKANGTQVEDKARLLFSSIEQTYVRMQTPTKHVQSSHSSQDASKSDANTSKNSNTNHKSVSRGHQPPNAAPTPAQPPNAAPAQPPNAAPVQPPNAAPAQPTRQASTSTVTTVGYYSRAGRALRRVEQKKIRASGSGPSNGDRIKWTIDDLPRGVDRNKWSVFMVPRFLSHFARKGEPWESNHYLEHAQTIWIEYFPECPHVLTHNEDAVYPLLRQHLYDYRSGFAVRAERAVELFFETHAQFASSADIQRYVEWAVPAAEVKSNHQGKTIMVENHIFPYMYRYSPRHKMDENDTFKGAFQHECILNTFAHHLEIIDHFPSPTAPANRPPYVALALAAVAVEKALKQWSTGEFVPDMSKFSASEWGIQTYDLRLAVNQLTEANWERIIEKAREFFGIFRKPGSFRAKQLQ